MGLLQTSLAAFVLTTSSAAALQSGIDQGEPVVKLGSLNGRPFNDQEGPFSMRRWTLSARDHTRLLGTDGRAEGPPQGEEAVARAVSQLKDRVLAITSGLAERLQGGLGPAWRVRVDKTLASRNWADVLNASPADEFLVGVLITLDGPSGAGGGEAVQRAVVAATEAHLTARDAEALPPGPERVAAEAKAKELNAEAEQAISAIRIDTRILQLRFAVGEDVAKALKGALPWGSFATVGGTQIVASGTATELAVAEKLAQQLDRIAMEQNERQKSEYEERVRNSPSGRVLTSPLTIDFKGGSVFDYLNMLAGVANTRSWMVEDPRVMSATLPAITLKGVTVDTALKLLDGLAITLVDGNATTSVPLIIRRIDSDSRDSDAPPVYRIGVATKNPKSAGAERPAPPVLTEVFDVSIGVDTEDEQEAKAKVAAAHDVLLAALEAGTSLVGPSKSFQVKLHPPSKMLFVSGTPEEIQLVRTIVQQWQSVQ